MVDRTEKWCLFFGYIHHKPNMLWFFMCHIPPDGGCLQWPHTHHWGARDRFSVQGWFQPTHGRWFNGFFCLRDGFQVFWELIYFYEMLRLDGKSHNPAKSNRGSSQQIWWLKSGMGNHPKKIQRGTGRQDFPTMLEAPGLPLTLIQPESEVVDTRWCPRLRKRVQLVN